MGGEPGEGSGVLGAMDGGGLGAETNATANKDNSSGGGDGDGGDGGN